MAVALVPLLTVQAVEHVHALSAGTATPGTLKLTNFHIIFCAPAPTPAPPPPPPKDNAADPPAPPHTPVRQRESWITYPIIAQCTYRPTPATSGIPSSVRLRCRDFNFVCFNFADDKQAREVFEFIRTRTCRLGSIEKLYAFSYVPARQEKALCGWDVYDARAEFRRQGISEKLPDRGWRISHINRDYAFSPTYPQLLVVPSKISDNVLKYAGQFRSRARIPALTYYHPITQCSITRSSQPLVGVRNNRSIQDERLVSACFYKSTAVFGGGHASGSGTASPQEYGSGSGSGSGSGIGIGSGSNDAVMVSHDETAPDGTAASAGERAADDAAAEADDGADDKPGSRIVGARRDNLIVDARPAINSLAMQVVGKGSENMDYYKSATKMFLSIDNIHVMRDSLNKVIEAVKDADISPLPPNQDLLAKSGWLKHIRGILTGSQTIARQVGVHAAHVLIHCSDGWDRTSQLSALSQIMLDPYFRTIDGFVVLVEKDWLSFGHMFQQRSGYLGSEKWFVTQYDAMAGTKIEPGEGGDGRSEVFDNAVASARRFFKKSLSQDKDKEREESDGDGGAAGGGGGGGGGDDYASSGGGGPSGKGGAAAMPVEESQATRPREISPVFHQFLDATYQLVRQHPTRFEFNERFLRRLLYHLYSCQYGTFLYNNERQRRDARVRERTSSVWDYFLSRRAEFLNPQYDAAIDSTERQDERLLFPKLDQIRWWHQAFNRTDQDMNAALHAAAAAAERTASYQATMTTAAAPATVVVTPGDDDPAAAGSGPNSSSSSSQSASVFAPSPRRGASPMEPPPLQTSQSAGGALETSTPPAHHVAVPSAATARSMFAMPVAEPPKHSSTAGLARSTSAGEPGAFAALRDGIAGLGIGQRVGGVLGSLGAVAGGGSGGGSGSGGGGGSGSGGGSSGISNISGREALFGLGAERDDGSGAETSVFDSFVGGNGSSSGGRRSHQGSRPRAVEQELRDL